MVEAIPVTPEEDEAWDALAERLAVKVAERLREERDERPLLNVKEAAARLGIDPKSLRDLVNWKGDRPPQLASVQIGDGARRIEQAEIERYLAERRRRNAEYRGPDSVAP